MAKSIKILIRRDTIENYLCSDFIPKPCELIAAYTEDSDTVIYKLGDGKNYWADLPEITKLSELDKFIVFAPGASVECLLSPKLVKNFVQSTGTEKGW